MYPSGKSAGDAELNIERDPADRNRAFSVSGVFIVYLIEVWRVMFRRRGALLFFRVGVIRRKTATRANRPAWAR